MSIITEMFDIHNYYCADVFNKNLFLVKVHNVQQSYDDGEKIKELKVPHIKKYFYWAQVI